MMEGHIGVLVGSVNNDLKLTPMRNVWSRKKDVCYDLLQLTEFLS